MKANMKSIRNVLASILLIACLCISMVGCTDIQDATKPTDESVLIESSGNTIGTQIPEETDSVTEPDMEATAPSETETTPSETIHIHSYTSKVTAPSCTEGGYTTFACTCGDTYTAEQTDPIGHNYASKIKTATCTEKGYTTCTCSTCGDTYTADQTNATGHNYSEKVTAPTCADKGYTTYTCSACGDSYTGNETNATGHSWGSWKVTKEPTTTTEGTEQRTCKTCGKTDTRTIDKLPEETEPAYETFSGTIGSYNAHNLAYTDWKGDTEQAAYIEIYTVEKNDEVLNDLAAEFEKVYGFAPSLGDKYRCTSACEKVGTYMVDGYSEPQTVYHYSITDKTYIYITNPMYTVYTQQCADGSVWVGYCVYATMDTIGTERNKAEVQALDQEMYATFAELIGVDQDELYLYKEELDLKIGYISEAGTVRSIHSDKPVQVLYIYCRGIPLEG